jgi:hypothetical protein
MIEIIKRKPNKEQGSKKKEEPKKFDMATIEQLEELRKHFNENYSNKHARGKEIKLF